MPKYRHFWQNCIFKELISAECVRAYMCAQPGLQRQLATPRARHRHSRVSWGSGKFLAHGSTTHHQPTASWALLQSLSPSVSSGPQGKGTQSVSTCSPRVHHHFLSEISETVGFHLQLQQKATWIRIILQNTNTINGIKMQDQDACMCVRAHVSSKSLENVKEAVWTNRVQEI